MSKSATSNLHCEHEIMNVWTGKFVQSNALRLSLLLVISSLLEGDRVGAQDLIPIEVEMRLIIPSATAIDDKLFEKIARSPEAITRDTFTSHSLTAELMLVDFKRAQESNGQFRYLTDGRMPKPTQLAEEMYHSLQIGTMRYTMQPVTMIQAKRITKLEAKVDGKTATGSFEFRVPELYEGKADFVAEKTGDEWQITRLMMPKLKIDIRADASGNWSRASEAKEDKPTNPAATK